MISSLWFFGLLVGMRHALEPDHLAAVSTLVVEQRRASSGVVLGGYWGLGHSLALLCVATLLGLAGGVMPERLATVFELAVAFMLIAIGLRSLQRAHRARANVAHPHPHSHAPSYENPAGGGGAPGRWSFARRSLVIGSVHGLAGSGALTALVASRLPSLGGRLLYVALFGLGSVLGMAALSGVAGWPLSRLSRSPGLARLLTMSTGLFATGLGVVWGLPLVRELFLN
ncbi:MAG: hypothetical protein ABUS79_21490 [Pseudomonadota bacterium]